LRKAFDDLLKDAEYREQTTKSGLTLDGALPGADVQKSVDRIHAVPKETWEVLAKAQAQAGK